ncbi:hypothetical protein HBI81_001580 [Parastagonospora nodorum]|nr:hypothetical protein HBI81_001580 [Parastagonospora nodorum]
MSGLCLDTVFALKLFRGPFRVYALATQCTEFQVVGGRLNLGKKLWSLVRKTRDEIIGKCAEKFGGKSARDDGSACILPSGMTLAEGWCLLLKRGRGEASKTRRATARGAQPSHVKPQIFQPPSNSLRPSVFTAGIVDAWPVGLLS